MGTWTPGPGPTDGNDVYFGDTGVDIVDGGLGDDTLFGDDGDDNLTGGQGSDSLGGGRGNDTLHGGDGNDYLNGHIGDDTLYGDQGDDWLLSGGGTGVFNDAYYGGQGNDNIVLGVTDVLGVTGVTTIDGGDGFDVLQLNHQVATYTFSAGSTVTGIEALYLQGQLTVDPSTLASVPVIWGRGGALIMRTAGVWDLSSRVFPSSFSYDTGLGSIQTINDASLSVIGTSGNDTITLPTAAGARIFIFGRTGDDTLTGSGAADIMSGDQGNDVVHGGGGNDEIGLFGGGVDSIFGDDGDDTFYFRGDNFPNYVEAPANTPLVATVNGGSGDDTLIITQGVIGAGTSFTSIETTIISYVSQGPITMAAGTLPTTGTLICLDARLVHSSGGVTDFSAMYIPLAGSSNGLSTTPMTFTGSSGNDTFLWSPTSQVAIRASGGAGDDVIRGGMGNDILDPGAGIDIVDGRGGDDTLTGSIYTTYIGGDGYDVVDFSFGQGAGIDILTTGSGTAPGSTFSGVERFLGSNTAGDFMYGDDAANRFEGNGGNDTLDGRGGNDILIGGAGVDRLFGGAGDDTIYFDPGDDLANVQGGDGADTLIVTGGPATSFNLASHGFEVAQVRFSITGATYTDFYDSQWRLSHEEGRANNGASWFIDWDETGTAPYERLNQDFDASGQLTHEYGLSDNGSTWDLFFDTDSTHPYVSILQVHTASGIYATEHGINDNGSTWDTFYDVDGSNPFQWIQQVRDANGVLAQEEGLADGGTRWFTDYDETGTTDYVFYQNVYDTLNRLSFQNGQYDTGYTWTIDYDETETQPWTSIRNDYDDHGVLIGTTTIWDGP